MPHTYSPQTSIIVDLTRHSPIILILPDSYESFTYLTKPNSFHPFTWNPSRWTLPVCHILTPPPCLLPPQLWQLPLIDYVSFRPAIAVRTSNRHFPNRACPEAISLGVLLMLYFFAIYNSDTDQLHLLCRADANRIGAVLLIETFPSRLELIIIIIIVGFGGAEMTAASGAVSA